MALPAESLNIPEDTAVIGDVDAFIAYIESGQAELEWLESLAVRYRKFEELPG